MSGDSHWAVLYKRLKDRRDELQKQILGGTLDHSLYLQFSGAYREVQQAIDDMDRLMRGDFRQREPREPLPSPN